MNPNIWTVSEFIKVYLKQLNFVKDFNIKTKEHDSLYSFYDDYIDVTITIDEQKYIAEKLSTNKDLETELKKIAGRYVIYITIA